MRASTNAGNGTPGLATTHKRQTEVDNFSRRMKNAFEPIKHLDAAEVLARILLTACYRLRFSDLTVFVKQPSTIGQIPGAVQDCFKDVQKQVRPVINDMDPINSTGEVFDRAVAFLGAHCSDLPALEKEIADAFHDSVNNKYTI